MKHKKTILGVAIFLFFVGAAQAQNTSNTPVFDVVQKRLQMDAVRAKARQQTEQDNMRIRSVGARPNMQPALSSVPVASSVGSNAATPVVLRTKPVLKKGEKRQ